MSGLRGRAVAVAAAGLAALAVGCGGDDEPQLTDAELRAQVDAACTRAAERLADIDPPSSGADAAAVGRQADEVTAELVGALRGLDGSGTAQEAVDRMLSTFDRSADLAGEMAEAVRSGDDARLDALQAELAGLADELEEAAVDGGFAACAGL